MEYIALPQDDPQREMIERRYGKGNVTRLVKKFEEDQANKQWLDKSTIGCPSCHVKVEKSVGCNHVSCGCSIARNSGLTDRVAAVDDVREMRPALLLPLWR